MNAGSPRGGSREGADSDRSASGADTPEDVARRRSTTMFRYSALGLQVVITFAVLAYAGIWLDRRYDLAPWGTLGGIGLGLIAMFTTLLKEGGGLKSRAEREREAAEREHTDRSG